MWVGNLFPCKFVFFFKGAPEFPPNSLLSFLLLVMVSQPSSSPGARGRRLVLPKGCAAACWGWSTACVFLERPARQENALSPDGAYPRLHRTAWLVRVSLASLSPLGERAPTEWCACFANLVGNGENCWGHTVVLVREITSFQAEKIDWERSNRGQHLLI